MYQCWSKNDLIMNLNYVFDVSTEYRMDKDAHAYLPSLLHPIEGRSSLIPESRSYIAQPNNPYDSPVASVLSSTSNKAPPSNTVRTHIIPAKVDAQAKLRYYLVFKEMATSWGSLWIPRSFLWKAFFDPYWILSASSDWLNGSYTETPKTFGRVSQSLSDFSRLALFS